MSVSVDYTLARNKMVDGQIRPVRVGDPRIIAAMRTLPRELFVPEPHRELAYIDTPHDLGHGRSMLEPRVLARLVQLAEPRAGERALVIGANTGYGAALLASLGLHVTAIEDDERLLAIAREAAAAAGVAVAFEHGTLTGGAANAEPFDVVLIEGGVEQIPAGLDRAVRVGGGRLVTVMLDGSGGHGVVAENNGAGLRARPHFDAAARLLPGFGKPAGFRF